MITTLYMCSLAELDALRSPKMQRRDPLLYHSLVNDWSAGKMTNPSEMVSRTMVFAEKAGCAIISLHGQASQFPCDAERNDGPAPRRVTDSFSADANRWGSVQPPRDVRLGCDPDLLGAACLDEKGTRVRKIANAHPRQLHCHCR